MESIKMHSTTVVCVRKNGKVSMAADGQVTLGQTIFKSKAKKVRKINNNTVLAGFAGASADAFTLLDKFEEKLKDFSGDLLRASVELTKEWRMDRYLRKLEAMLIVANNDAIFIISGNGDVIAPDEDVAAIGSGGSYALAAGLALTRNTSMDAAEISRKSLEIASSICIYTNENITLEELS
jgi:ATP-dependent HslUV protease subunit HslV